jgi:GTP pyrophosphokinase
MARGNAQLKTPSPRPRPVANFPLLPADSADSLLTHLLGSYLKPDDIAQVMAAYRYSAAAHEGQMRKSGEPYISHPVTVACILAELHLDAQALMAALLHDVIEDTGATHAHLTELFGKTVAELVDGVSKLDKIEFQNATHAQAENFRKMLLAMSQDVRVILIKLADRLHNMRTMDVMAPEKRSRIARETLEIYAPIANRLGLNRIYQELEDLSFQYLYPMRHRVLLRSVKAARGNRKEVVGKILDEMRHQLAEAEIEAEIKGREKHLYSIYRKMLDKVGTFSQVFDIYGFRVIVKDTPTCYLALGALHALYKPIPGKFKDYIAIPKANGYQSLHSTLFGPFGTPIEVQIRSRDMHNIAEAGVAAHWLYKTSDADLSMLQQQTHQWLQRLLEIQSESSDSVEFLEHFKVDLFPDEVYVFTPKGKILSLPKGATAVDFAYAVHTDIGNRCVAVKINHELAPLRSELHNGDHVEIITAAHAKPNPMWLNYVATGKARSHIRHFLKAMQSEESAHLGERLLNQALRALHADTASIDESRWEKLFRDYGVKSKQEVLTDIGLGKRLNLMVARQLLALSEPHAEKSARPLGNITIRGTEGMAVQFAKCCRPIPGDPILGFINKGKGLVIHTHDCPAIAKFRHDPDKWLDVEWDPEIRRLFKVGLKLTVANERGVLAKVASVISEAGSNIDNIGMDEGDDSAYTSMHFTVQVEDRVHLAKLMRSLRKISEVVRLNRIKGSNHESHKQ